MATRDCLLALLLAACLAGGAVAESSSVQVPGNSLAQAAGWIEAGNYAEALELLGEDPSLAASAQAHQTLRARALLGLERLPEAEAAIRRGLEWAPEDAGLYLLAGKVYSLQGDHQKEIAALSQAVKLAPEDPEAHFLLSMAYDELGNSPKVLEHAQRAIRLDPRYKEKLKARIPRSTVSRKIGEIVSQVLRDSRQEKLTSEQIEAYAARIQRILGEKLPEVSRDPAQRQEERERLREKLRAVLTRSASLIEPPSAVPLTALAGESDLPGGASSERRVTPAGVTNPTTSVGSWLLGPGGP